MYSRGVLFGGSHANKPMVDYMVSKYDDLMTDKNVSNFSFEGFDYIEQHSFGCRSSRFCRVRLSTVEGYWLTLLAKYCT